MHFSVVTLFPQMFQALDFGITSRALKRQLISINYYNPRDYTDDPHKTVDDRPYGGGPGMVMKYEPLALALQAAKKASPQKPTTIYLSPQGKPLTQAILSSLSQKNSLILLAGRYEGIDERLLEQEIDEEYSLGDYILSGGELAAMVLIDGITRLLPEALGDELSAQQDSFSEGLLDCPHYTRPESINGQDVPSVLLGGDHAAIKRWRMKQSLGRTWLRRPDLMLKQRLTTEQQILLNEFIKEINY